MITKYIMIGGVILILIMGGIIKYQHSENQTLNQNLATAKADTQRLKGEIEEQNDSIFRLENQRISDQVDMNNLSDKLSEHRKIVKQYKKIFKDHDLERLTRARPGMMEKRINNGTKRVLKAFEKITKKEVKNNEK